MASIFLPKYLSASLTLLPLNRASPTLSRWRKTDPEPNHRHDMPHSV